LGFYITGHICCHDTLLGHEILSFSKNPIWKRTALIQYFNLEEHWAVFTQKHHLSSNEKDYEKEIIRKRIPNIEQWNKAKKNTHKAFPFGNHED
jgi:hypothetical protein